MDMTHTLTFFRRWWKYLLAVAIIFGGLGFALSAQQSSVYSSEVKLLLRPNDPAEQAGNSPRNIDSGAIEQAVLSDIEVVRSPTIRRRTEHELDLSDGALKDVKISVNRIATTNAISISAERETPELARQTADAVAKAYIDNRREYSIANLDLAITQLDTQLSDLNKTPTSTLSDTEKAAVDARISTVFAQRQQLAIERSLKRGEAEIISDAQVPTDPISPKPAQTALLAAILGLLGAIGVLLAFEQVRHRATNREVIADIFDAPIVGEIPDEALASNDLKTLVSVSHPDSLFSEAIRSLRASLRFLSVDEPIRTVLVTSALPNAGKTQISANLAASLASTGLRTLLISADLRRPTLERLFDLKDIPPGLTDAVVWAPAPAGRRSQRNGVLDMVPAPITTEHANLWLLPAGAKAPDPFELLASDRFQKLLAEYADQFDMVILDSSPVLPVSDALAMVPEVDIVLVVSSLGEDKIDELKLMRERLDEANPRLLGVVLNRVRAANSRAYQGYGNDEK